MARRTLVQLIDDLDGKQLEEGDGRTVHFAFERTAYEIDLSDKNIDKLEKVLAPYIEAGRKSVSSRQERPRPGRARDYVPAEVRAWAQSKGIAVPERGRIPSDILDQYRSTN